MSSGVSAILLAAGESRRMGPVNKLTLPIDGIPLVLRTLQTLLQSQLAEVIVVLGHEQDRVRKLLEDIPVRIVFNERFRQGQMTSVVCGLQALPQVSKGVMVCLCDQALLDVADINRLVNHFLAKPVPVLVPTYQGQRGNPIILASHYCADILKQEPNLGCKHFIENNPQLVTTLAFDNDHVVFDLDTADDVAQLQQRLAEVNPQHNPVPAVRGA